MTKRKSDFTLSTTSLDELFSSQEKRDDAKPERAKEIPLNELHPFRNHPFKIQNDEEMKRLIESIQKFGTLTPTLAQSIRLKKSSHRRGVLQDRTIYNILAEQKPNQQE